MRKRAFFCLLIAIFSVASLFLLADTGYAQTQKSFPRLLFFYSDDCHVCQKVKNEIMPAIEREFFDRVVVEYLNISDKISYQLLLSLKEKYKCYEKGVPTVFIAGKILVGYDRIKEGLKSAIIEALKKQKFEWFQNLPQINLIKHFLSFGALTIIIAGLIDGINPCAFTVIVFFISFLAFQGYRKREIVLIGLSFISAVFLTYVFIGLGIFRFLYALQKFYLVTRLLYYLVALFCFILAFFAFYDLWLFIKNKKTEGMFLQLPRKAKNIIHFIIGSYYRRAGQDRQAVPTQRRLAILIGSSLLTGCLVSSIEGLCTGQLYLPMITFVLKEPALKLRAFGYLLLYNFMFIVPLLIIMFLALLGTSSEGFSKFMRSHLVSVKLALGLLFFLLGIFILWGA